MMILIAWLLTTIFTVKLGCRSGIYVYGLELYRWYRLNCANTIDGVIGHAP